MCILHTRRNSRGRHEAGHVTGASDLEREGRFSDVMSARHTGDVLESGRTNDILTQELVKCE